MKNPTLNEMKEALIQFYEAAGFADYDKNVLSKMNVDDIINAYNSMMSQEEDDGQES